MATNSNDKYMLSCTRWEYGYQPRAKFDGTVGTLDEILKHAVNELIKNNTVKAVFIKRKSYIGAMTKAVKDANGGYHSEKIKPIQHMWIYKEIGVVSKVQSDWSDEGFGYRYIWIPYGGAGRDITPKSLIKKKTVRRR